MKKAVIIGAGQTGRGFISPILKENEFEIIFLDKNQNLVSELNKQGKYQIRYFADVKETEEIKNFKAYDISSKQAMESLIKSDLIITSVFASHIVELIPYLKKVNLMRTEPLLIICCENGVNVKKPLVDVGLNAIISEGIIFCTTLKPYKDSLDLISEGIETLPIDGNVEGLNIQIHRMPLEYEFSSLIQRKIYTYNFISAVVAYLGWYKKYDVYSEAANDAEINEVIQGVKTILSNVIAKEYDIPFKEQLTFTQRAIDKFQNREIFDTIYRNARQSKRKLGNNERLVSPLKFAQKYNVGTIYFDLIIATAIFYGVNEESEDVDEIWDSLEINNDKKIVKDMYEMLNDSKSISEILKYF